MSCSRVCSLVVCFFVQAEDGIRDATVTGVQTCALPISLLLGAACRGPSGRPPSAARRDEIGRAAGRERGEISGGAGSLKKKKQNNRTRAAPAWRAASHPLRRADATRG